MTKYAFLMQKLFTIEEKFSKKPRNRANFLNQVKICKEERKYVKGTGKISKNEQ